MASSSSPSALRRPLLALLAAAATAAAATAAIAAYSSNRRAQRSDVQRRRGRREDGGRAAEVEPLHVHLHLSGVTVRESDLALFRSLLHTAVTLTHGPDVHRGTQLLIANFPTTEGIAAVKDTLQAVIFPFAGIPPAMLAFFASELPHVSVHNLHHNAPPTAEMALGLLLAAAKLLVPADRQLRENDWKAGGGPSLSITLEEEHAGQVILDGKTALILGYGAIGRRIGRACRAMGMAVKGVRRSVTRQEEDEDDDGSVELVSLTSLDHHLPTTTALIVCLPATPATEGLIGRKELALLPPEAIVVNVGRGAVVDEEALHQALREKKIHAAGLDVWWAYPTRERPRMPPSRFDFASLANVVMSPHRGGAAGIAESETRRMQALAELINDALEEQGTVRGLGNRVCVTRGY